MLIFVIFFSIFIGKLHGVVYDAYSGKPATVRQLRLYNERNNTQNCLIDVEPCDPNDWRRIDGTCNNLIHPSRGSPRTPTIRLLTPDFSVDYEPRNAKCGGPLPLARYVRTELLSEGKTNDLAITQLVSYYVLFGLSDVNSIHDVFNYVVNTTNCCTPEGKSNYACIPNKIPVHDPVHRYSGVSCQNLTRPQTFQYFGCLDFGTTFARIVYATPVFDLSTIYGYFPGSIDRIRSYQNGMLKFDMQTFIQTGKIFPIGDHTEAYNRNHCLLNQYPRESLCYTYQQNTVLGSNLLQILYYRQHNDIAEQLHKMNPCWDDDRLFYTARDINIAIHMQIYFYELLPIFLGRRNMEREGLLLSNGGFRDLYNEYTLPQITDEFVYMQRWFHTIQEASVEFYDADGFYLKSVPMVNITLRNGFVADGYNMADMLRGSFRQPCGKFDYTIDFDMAERALGGLNLVSDVAMNDLSKGRYFGFQPYVKYREFCTKKSYKCFDDLRDVISNERLYRLKIVYQNVDDIELMSGTWTEDHVPGSRVPHTLYCLLTEQLKRTLASDRHWYERPNRPHAFTKEQLQAIRKVTVAGLLCTQGDCIPDIQPRAFYSIDRQYNPLLSCNSPEIGKLNLNPWKDQTC